MSSFRYRLETILTLRIAERDRLRAQLAEAYQAQQILQQHAEQIDQELRQTQVLLRNAAAPGAIEVDSLLGAHRQQMLLRLQKATVQQQTSQVEAETERRRLAVVEADRRVRTLENLRERRREEHRRAQNKAAMKHLDEVALRRVVKVEEEL